MQNLGMSLRTEAWLDGMYAIVICETMSFALCGLLKLPKIKP